MSKTITAATLAATLCLAVALPAAHAGGGMGRGQGPHLCRLILNGSANQPQTVSVTDNFASGDVVKVNALVLLCDLPAVGVTQNGRGNRDPRYQSQRRCLLYRQRGRLREDSDDRH